MPIAKRHRARLALALAFLLMLVCSAFLLVPTKKAEATSPSCGDVIVSGSSWAGGHGVDVHSNAPHDGDVSGTSCAGSTAVYNLSANPPQWGLGWQCVELAVRMYKTQGWKFPSAAAAVDIYTNAASVSLTTMDDGSITLSSIVPGDMIVTHEATYGHVMLVDRIIGNTVYYIDQNGADGGMGSATYDPTTKKLSAGSYYQISGVVHSPDNTLTNGGTTPTPSAPTIITRSSTTLNVFYTINGNLINQWWDSSTGVWVRQSWSANATGRPAVVVRNNGQDMTVFYRTKSGGIDQLYMSSGVWNTPANLIPAEVWSDPAAASIDNGHQTVAWVDIHGALKQRTWDNTAGGWQGITTIMAADVISHPVLTARSATTMDGFVIKSNQNLVHFSWGSSGWSWSDWTAGAVGSPSECNLNDGSIDGVYRKNIGYLEDRYWDWRYGWMYKDWVASMATDPSATALNGVGYAVYGETGSNLVVRNLTSGYSNSVFGSIDKGYTPSVTTRNGMLEITFWASDGSLKHLQIDPSNLVATVSETIAQKA